LREGRRYTFPPAEAVSLQDWRRRREIWRRKRKKHHRVCVVCTMLRGEEC
jgi:hypothetical protein